MASDGLQPSAAPSSNSNRRLEGAGCYASVVGAGTLPDSTRDQEQFQRQGASHRPGDQTPFDQSSAPAPPAAP